MIVTIDKPIKEKIKTYGISISENAREALKNEIQRGEADETSRALSINSDGIQTRFS
jgi:post-segregation antitoxin (ccd killing protein)